MFRNDLHKFAVPNSEIQQMGNFLIGIDDTDNKESRGTGFRARQLAHLLEENSLGQVQSITRHQLFFDPRIPYTSHNSSACLSVTHANKAELKSFCRDFMLQECAPGSDGGLCIHETDLIHDNISEWGLSAKSEVLTKDDAKKLAAAHQVYLEGLTGTHDGIIGALAAIGLHKAGNDGRCIWLSGKELRELNGVYAVKKLTALCAVDEIRDTNGNMLAADARLFVGDWVRPALKNHKMVLFVEKALNTEEYEWIIAPKSYIKRLTD